MLTKKDSQKVEDEIKTHQLDLMGKNVQKIRMCVCLLQKKNKITLHPYLFKCLWGYYCHQVATSKAHIAIILAKTIDAKNVQKFKPNNQLWQ